MVSNVTAHEALATHHRYRNVHLRVRIAHSGLPLPTIGRDPPLRSHRFWRDTHLQRLPHRHRLQIPLQRIVPGIVVVSVYLPSIPALFTLHLYTLHQ